MKVSGHRFGRAEVEGAIASCEGVAEAAVISVPHAIKGESVVAFVSLKEGYSGSPEYVEKIKKQVGEFFSPIAKPDQIFFIRDLPKTRSGKIVRRLLKALYLNEPVGDLSTLQDPSLVEDITTILQGLRDKK